ncbi:hypothetical protein KO465_02775 [Candidatus Micrarchaeota archaeon]|nr:hypothetical protein [Candidatus Micrarchaeota archaeon]
MDDDTKKNIVPDISESTAKKLGEKPDYGKGLTTEELKAGQLTPEEIKNGGRGKIPDEEKTVDVPVIEETDVRTEENEQGRFPSKEDQQEKWGPDYREIPAFMRAKQKKPEEKPEKIYDLNESDMEPVPDKTDEKPLFFEIDEFEVVDTTVAENRNDEKVKKLISNLAEQLNVIKQNKILEEKRILERCARYYWASSKNKDDLTPEFLDILEPATVAEIKKDFDELYKRTVETMAKSGRCIIDGKEYTDLDKKDISEVLLTHIKHYVKILIGIEKKDSEPVEEIAEPEKKGEPVIPNNKTKESYENAGKEYADLLVAKEKIFRNKYDKQLLLNEKQIIDQYQRYLENEILKIDTEQFAEEFEEKKFEKEIISSELRKVAQEMGKKREGDNRFLYGIERRIRSVPGIVGTFAIGAAGLAFLPVSAVVGGVLIGTFAILRGVSGYLTANGLMTGAHRFFRQRFGENEMSKLGASVMYHKEIGYATTDASAAWHKKTLVKIKNFFGRLGDNTEILERNIDADKTTKDISEGLVNYAVKFRRYKIIKTIVSVAAGIAAAIISPDMLKNMVDGIKSTYTANVAKSTEVVPDTTIHELDMPGQWKEFWGIGKTPTETVVPDSLTVPMDATTQIGGLDPLKGTMWDMTTHSGMAPYATGMAPQSVIDTIAQVDTLAVAEETAVMGRTAISSAKDAVSTGLDVSANPGEGIWHIAERAAESHFGESFTSLPEDAKNIVIDKLTKSVLADPTKVGLEAGEMMKDTAGATTWLRPGATIEGLADKAAVTDMLGKYGEFVETAKPTANIVKAAKTVVKTR